MSPKPSENHQEPSERERSAKKQRIAHDWTPDGKLVAWAKEKRPDLNLAEVVENFRDHWIAKGEARASWEASFRTWVRREQQRAGTRRPTSHTGLADKNYTEGVNADGSLA